MPKILAQYSWIEGIGSMGVHCFLEGPGIPWSRDVWKLWVGGKLLVGAGPYVAWTRFQASAKVLPDLT